MELMLFLAIGERPPFTVGQKVQVRVYKTDPIDPLEEYMGDEEVPLLTIVGGTVVKAEDAPLVRVFGLNVWMQPHPVVSGTALPEMYNVLTPESTPEPWILGAYRHASIGNAAA